MIGHAGGCRNGPTVRSTNSKTGNDGVATAVDAVTSSPQVATGTYALSAEAVRIGRDRIALRHGETVASERFPDPVTPVRHGTALWELLRGARPDHVFESVDGFRCAVETARSAPRHWRTDVAAISIRPVRWQGIEATLVGT